MGEKSGSAQLQWDPRAEVHCVHVETCGACPLMPRRYEEQRAIKLERLRTAIGSYELEPAGEVAAVVGASTITGYRRRAKLVVARTPGGGVSVGLYRRNDNQSVVDIPECQVLSPVLMDLVATLRKLCADP